MTGVTGVRIFSLKGQRSGLRLGLRSAVEEYVSTDGRILCRHWADIFGRFTSLFFVLLL